MVLVHLSDYVAGGDEGNRTLDPLLAGQVLSQLSYTPVRVTGTAFGRLCGLVGLDGLEPSTSRLSGARSSHLSYKPRFQLIGSDSSICLPALPAGGDEGNRTLDPLLAGQVLSQLSYTPIKGLLLLFQ